MIQNLLKDKATLAIIVLFAIIGIVASELLVLDEETLVAACFVMFVLFAYQTMGDMIANELDDRANKISQELQKSFETKRELILAEIDSFKKQESLVSEIEDLYQYSQSLVQTIGLKRKNYLQNKIASQINQQLKLISVKEKEIINVVQMNAINSFCQSVLEEFKSSSAADARAQLLDESVQALKTVNQ